MRAPDFRQQRIVPLPGLLAWVTTTPVSSQRASDICFGCRHDLMIPTPDKHQPPLLQAGNPEW